MECGGIRSCAIWWSREKSSPTEERTADMNSLGRALDATRSPAASHWISLWIRRGFPVGDPPEPVAKRKAAPGAASKVKAARGLVLTLCSLRRFAQHRHVDVHHHVRVER